MAGKLRDRQKKKTVKETLDVPIDRGPAFEGSGESFLLYQMPGHLIRRLQQVAVSLFVEETGTVITPVQYAALMAVKTYPTIDQATLAGVIGYDRTTIGGVVDRLEAKGLVRRMASPNDRRLHLLVLEEEGGEILLRLAAAVSKAQERILEPLEPNKRAEFIEILSLLVVKNNKFSRAPMRPVPDRKRNGSR